MLQSFAHEFTVNIQQRIPFRLTECRVLHLSNVWHEYWHNNNNKCKIDTWRMEHPIRALLFYIFKLFKHWQAPANKCSNKLFSKFLCNKPLFECNARNVPREYISPKVCTTMLRVEHEITIYGKFSHRAVLEAHIMYNHHGFQHSTQQIDTQSFWLMFMKTFIAFVVLFTFHTWIVY